MAFNKRDTPAGLWAKLYASDAKKSTDLPPADPPKKQVKPLWKNTFDKGEEKK